MGGSFFEQPILNSPYEAPRLHHALDENGQPIDVLPVEGRRRSEIIMPVPMPRMQTGRTRQGSLALGDMDDPSVGGQEYNPTPSRHAAPRLMWEGKNSCRRKLVRRLRRFTIRRLNSTSRATL
jgi:hypothetical protein